MGNGRIIFRISCFSGIVISAFVLLGFGLFVCIRSSGRDERADEEASDTTTGIFMVCLAIVYIAIMSLLFVCCCCGDRGTNVLPHVVQVVPGPNTQPPTQEKMISDTLTAEVERVPSVIGVDADHVVVVVENPR